MSFSWSFMTRVRRCGPAMTRSIASSSARLSISCAFERAVSSAGGGAGKQARHAAPDQRRVLGMQRTMRALPVALAMASERMPAITAIDTSATTASAR